MELRMLTSGGYVYWVLSRFSRVRLFGTLWTIARQAPLSMGFSRQGHWSGLPCLLPEDLPNQGSNPSLLRLLHWQVGPLSLAPPMERIKWEKLAKSLAFSMDPINVPFFYFFFLAPLNGLWGLVFRIFVPLSGAESVLRTMEVWSPNHWTAREDPPPFQIAFSLLRMIPLEYSPRSRITGSVGRKI